MERELLGGSDVQLPPFDMPETRTPKMYKQMMLDICGKKPAKVTRPGYDPDIAGNCRNCGGRPGQNYRNCECDKKLADAQAK